MDKLLLVFFFFIWLVVIHSVLSGELTLCRIKYYQKMADEDDLTRTRRLIRVIEDRVIVTGEENSLLVALYAREARLTGMINFSVCS